MEHNIACNGVEGRVKPMVLNWSAYNSLLLLPHRACHAPLTRPPETLFIIGDAGMLPGHVSPMIDRSAGPSDCCALSGLLLCAPPR